jgi:hypothetical protein
MSGAGRIEGLGRELSRSLCDEPLEVHQLPVDLGVIPVAVTAALNAMIDGGFVHAMTVDGGRQAWGFTVKGRTRLLGEWER